MLLTCCMSLHRVPRWRASGSSGSGDSKFSNKEHTQRTGGKVNCVPVPTSKRKMIKLSTYVVLIHCQLSIYRILGQFPDGTVSGRLKGVAWFCSSIPPLCHLRLRFVLSRSLSRALRNATCRKSGIFQTATCRKCML